MNRVIKFKVWWVDEKEFVPYYSIGDGFVHVAIGDQLYLVNNIDAPEEHKKSLREKNIEIRDEFILCQFTGLTDKNGVEIYEGDIVKVMGTKKVGEYITTVEYSGQMFHLKENKTYIVYGKELITVLEVLGNIHTHPHLLTN